MPPESVTKGDDSWGTTHVRQRTWGFSSVEAEDAPDSEAESGEHSAPQESNFPPSVDPEGSGPPVSVLIVDDDPKNLTAMEVALADSDVEQVQARSGEEALRHLLRKDFAIILLDVQMPGMDGFETAKIIRSRRKNQYVPIIFVTAYSHGEADMRKGYALGAVDYLFKPIMPEVLRAKVQSLVEIRKRTLQVEEQARKLRMMERTEAEHRLSEERRKWEANALRRQNQQLAESDRKKDEFIAVLAHELRNPLAPLVNALESMSLSGLPTQELVQAHGVMDRQVRHLKRLVDDLLDVSRISRGKLELRRGDIDLRLVVQHAIESCRSQLERRQQIFRTSGPEFPVSLFGDRVRLVQMLVNLLTNASRYTDSGGEIVLDWGLVSEREAFIRVRDTGKGIAPEARERIFEMFVQEREGGRGLGLGLTLVRQIIQMHQGSVEVRSDGPDRGSEFEVRLPLDRHPSRPPPPDEGVLVSAVLPVDATLPAFSSVPHAPLTASTRRVVLIEDDEDVRETLALLLRQWGHDVQTACNGPDGIELVKTMAPEVVFLDIGLPGMDGHAVAAHLRNELGSKQPKLVALSGYGQKRDREKSREVGFDAHLVKPADPKELKRLLQELH